MVSNGTLAKFHGSCQICPSDALGSSFAGSVRHLQSSEDSLPAILTEQASAQPGSLVELAFALTGFRKLATPTYTKTCVKD